MSAQSVADLLRGLLSVDGGLSRDLDQHSIEEVSTPGPLRDALLRKARRALITYTQQLAAQSQQQQQQEHGTSRPTSPPAVSASPSVWDAVTDATDATDAPPSTAIVRHRASGGGGGTPEGGGAGDAATAGLWSKLRVWQQYHSRLQAVLAELKSVIRTALPRCVRVCVCVCARVCVWATPDDQHDQLVEELIAKLVAAAPSMWTPDVVAKVRVMLAKGQPMRVMTQKVVDADRKAIALWARLAMPGAEPATVNMVVGYLAAMAGMKYMANLMWTSHFPVSTRSPWAARDGFVGHSNPFPEDTEAHKLLNLCYTGECAGRWVG